MMLQILLILVLSFQVAYAEQRLKIGVLAVGDKQETTERWQPLAQYLNRGLPDYSVQIEGYSYDELKSAIERRQIDFVLTHAVNYIQMNELSALSSPLVTLIDRDNDQALPVYGGTIVSRADRDDLQSLRDLKDSKVATSSLQGFANYLMQAYELHRFGLSIPDDVAVEQVDLPVDRAVLAVLEGKADAAFVQMGLIERLAREGKIKLDSLKVLNPRQMADFSYTFSTTLYPGWPLAAMPQVSEVLSARIAAALLLIPHDGELTRAIDIWGFSIPANYMPVQDAMKELRIHPYEQVPFFSWQDIWHRYKLVLLIVMGAGIIILLLLLWLLANRHRLNQQRRLLTEASHYARSLLEASLDPLITISAEGKITDVNTATEKVTGIERSQLIGSDFSNYFSDPEHARRGYLQVFADGQVRDYALAICHKSGRVTEVLYNASLYRNRQGQVEGVFATARDVTLQRIVENELRDAKQIAESANRTKSEFLANMSHEIRTPINAIIGFTELAQDTPLDAKQRDYLNKVQQASKSLLAIINDILDFSKIEAGKIDIELNPFAIEELLQDIGDLFALTVEGKGLELLIEVTERVPTTVIGDVMRLRQVLNNLVNNAIKFTEHGEILIKVDVLEQRADNFYLLEFSVRDTGIGMSRNETERLFMAFSQADASISRRFGGTGLGLAICRQLVDLMGGRISVSSKAGEGSCFVFTLPVTAIEVEHPARLLPDLSAKRALVVDDSATACLIVKRYLTSWGINVETEQSAHKALQLVQEADQSGAQFDMLLLDWQMPEMDGLQLAEQITALQQQGGLKQLPAMVMVTGHNRDTVQQATNDQVNLAAIISKPICVSSLYNTLLKLHKTELGNLNKPSAVKMSLADLARSIQGCYVLLVEDNSLNQLIAREFLKKAGLRLVVAENGAEAVDWVRREHFDAILMDVQMPVMDGFKAARHIRTLPHGKEVPIIAMTAAAMQHDRDACMLAGMNDHLAKPLNSKQMIETLLRWIKPVLQPTPAVSSTDDECETPIEVPEGFDFKNILPMLNGDVDHLLEILSIFRKDYAQADQGIAKHIEQGDTILAQQAVHQLKGVAGNLGAMALYQASQKLDDQLKQSLCPDAELQAWRSCFGDTLRAIDRLLERRSANDDRQETTLQRARELAVQLNLLLAQHDYIGGDLLAEFEAASGPGYRDQCKALSACVKKLDYQGAADILARWLAANSGGA